MTDLEKQSKVPRAYTVLGVFVVYLGIIFSNVGGIGEFLSNIAGFVVPAYYSLHALSTKTTKDDTELLTYWVVFAFLNVIEFWSSAILYWIPFYWLIKTIFLLWLSIPYTGGAGLVYANIVKPFADQHIVKKAAPAPAPAAAAAPKPAAATAKSTGVAGN